MRKPSSNTRETSLEKEYNIMRRDLYKKFFKCLLVILMIITTNEIYRSFFSSTRSSPIPLISIIFTMSIFCKFIFTSKGNIELPLTIFMTFYFGSSILRNYYGSMGYFNNPLDAFYCGYINSTFECITVSRISRLSHRTFFSIASFIIRLAIVPLNNKTQLVFQLIELVLKIYLDIDRERHDKNLFRSYYNSKEQLVKFKDLVVHEIPQGIAILDRNLTKFLFMNNTLQDLFTRERSGPNIQAALQKFKLHQSSDPNASPAAETPKQTLLNLIQQGFMAEGQPQTSKISCILNYQTIGDSSQDLAENAQLIFEASLMTIVWDDQPSIAIILRDITQQHTIMSLKIADAQKDTVLATVSHELRTPLNGMLGMIQIMEKKIREPELLQYLEVCKNSGSLLVSLVNSILDVNQIRANKLKLIPEKIDMYGLLNGVKALFDFQCKKKGIFLTIKISQISCIITDKNRLSQILINLIGNAIKFTSKGGITIMACQSRENPDYVKFSVEDTGVGIKDADKGKLFKVFGRLDNDDERINCQGVGLGLNISDNLARVLCVEEKLKGIRVDSQYGVGTTFSFLTLLLYYFNQKNQ